MSYTKKRKINVVLSLVLVFTMLFGGGSVFAEGSSEEEINENVFVTRDLKTGEEYTWEAEESNVTEIPATEPTIGYGNYENDGFDISTRGYDPNRWTKITNINRYPYSTIVHLDIYFNNSSTPVYGSGFIVGNGIVLTAAHCIQDMNGRKASKIVAYGSPTGSRGSATFTYEAQASTVNQQWAKGNTDIDYDYGMLRIRSDVNSITGTMGISTYVDKDEFYELAGYPQVKNNNNYNGLTLWTCAGYINGVYTNYIYHDMNNYGAISGSPVFNYNSRQAVAIHTRGENYIESKPKGYATRITQSVINLINS